MTHRQTIVVMEVEIPKLDQHLEKGETCVDEIWRRTHTCLFLTYEGIFKSESFFINFFKQGDLKKMTSFWRKNAENVWRIEGKKRNRMRKDVFIVEEEEIVHFLTWLLAWDHGTHVSWLEVDLAVDSVVAHVFLGSERYH